jgi:hypothetical protein
MVTCPAGHESSTADYCDVCGAVIGPPAAASTPAPAGTGETEAAPVAAPAAAAGPTCSNCGAPHEPGDAFCEVCGLDFATGDLPKPPPPPEELDAAEPSEAPETPAATPPAEAEEPGDWIVVIEPDQEWFERNEAEGAAGAVAFPEETTPEQLELTEDEVVIGRRSDSRTAQPDIELNDPGVSRRHAVLRRGPEGDWTIVDEESTNGTWVDDANDPIPAGEPVPLQDGSTVHLGAFTRLTFKRA